MPSLLHLAIATYLLEQSINIIEFAKKIGITEKEIQEKVHELKNLGLEIQQQKNIIYLKKPDPIHNSIINSIVHQHYQLTTSTQDLLKFTETRTNKIIAISSEFQHYGRGRTGKNWLTNYGKNILLSVLIPNFSNNFPLSLIIGYVLKNWLKQKYTFKKIHIKWPNDIFIEDSKLAGLLIETHPNLAYLIVGLGLNVHADPQNKKLLNQSQTSLEDLLGISIKRQELLEEILTIFVSLSSPKILEKFTAETQKSYSEADYFLNQPISSMQESGLILGIGRGIDTRGQYLIEQVDGTIIALNSGSIKIDRRRKA